MARPSIPGNKRSRVLYARDAYHTLIYMTHAWAVDCCVSLTKSQSVGPHSVGTSVLIGQYTTRDFLGRLTTVLSEDDADSDDSTWLLPPPEPDVNVPDSGLLTEFKGDVMTAENNPLAGYSLITLEAASEWLAAEFAIVMRSFNRSMLRQTQVGKAGRFRAMCYWLRAEAKQVTFLELGLERLKQVCLSQRRRQRGAQVIQTKKPIFAGYYQPFLFNGKHAIRVPPGRPALSESEWLRRYFARKRAAKKTNRKRTDSRGEKLPPQTKHGRPARTVERKLETFRKSVPTPGESNPQFEPDTEFDWSEIKKEFAEAAGDAIGDALGDAAKDLIKNWFE